APGEMSCRRCTRPSRSRGRASCVARAAELQTRPMFAGHAANAQRENAARHESDHRELDEQAPSRVDGRGTLGLDLERPLEDVDRLLRAERLLAATHCLDEIAAIAPGGG